MKKFFNFFVGGVLVTIAITFAVTWEDWQAESPVVIRGFAPQTKASGVLKGMEVELPSPKDDAPQEMKPGFHPATTDIAFPPIPEKSGAVEKAKKKEVKGVSRAERAAPRTAHIVKFGETIEGLAKRYGVLSWQLRAANGMEAKDSLLRPSQVLAIPSVNWQSRVYTGRASWYGPGFHGKRRADTTVYDQHDVLIAHRTLPLGTTVRITNLHNGRTIVAKVLDRGPYTKGKDGKYLREIDLSRGAAEALGAIKQGVIPVKIEPIA